MENKFCKREIIIINDLDEINDILKHCKELYTKIKKDEEAEILGIPGYLCYQVNEGRTKISVKCKYFSKKYAQYDFYLDGRLATITKDAMQCFSLLQRMSNKGVIDLTKSEFYDGINDKGKIMWNCGYNTGLLYINDKFLGKRTENVYGYDINSAYAWAIKQDMPDTSVKPKRNCVPNENEIGMSETSIGNDENYYLYIIENANDYGIECDYVFPKIKSPFVHFADYYYYLKSTAKTKEERQKYKEILNYSIGFIRRKNPFIHSAILSYARLKVQKLIDKNTICCNTDSIVSSKPRNDLEIGEKLGQFKIEHQNESFAINESGYQWNYEIPVVRGISKKWFQNGFDILKDKIPGKECNKYIYDEENEKIILNKEYEED